MSFVRHLPVNRLRYLLRALHVRSTAPASQKEHRERMRERYWFYA